MTESSGGWKRSYQPLLRVTIFAAVGILFSRILDPAAWIWITLLLSAGLAWLITFAWHRFAMASSTLLVAIFAFAGLWHHAHWHWIGPSDIGTWASEDAAPVMLRGTIASQPRWIAADPAQEQFARPRGIRSRFQVDVTDIRQVNRFVPASGKVEVFVDGQVGGLRSGDEIEFCGMLERTAHPTNPGQFDFGDYFRGRRILCWINVDHPDCLDLRVTSLTPMQWMSRLRGDLDQVLWRYLSPEYAPLASAMLLGNRDQLDRMQRDNFLLSGTVHLLAISGLHVGILAGLFLMLPRLGLISRRKGLLLTVIFVLTYAWLVEFRPPVLRAAILITVYCYCRWIGRTPISFNSLALAALVVLAINPTELFNTGAQLSFLAVGSLIFARHWLVLPVSDDPIDRLLRESSSWRERLMHQAGRKLYTAFAVSAIIWLMAVPLVAARFHVLAPIALLVNPFLLIPVTASLILGFGVLLTGWICPPLAAVLGLGCNGSFGLIQATVDACRTIPLGHFWTSGPPLLAIFVFYAAVIVAFLCVRQFRFRSFAAAIVLWWVAGWLVPDWYDYHRAQQRSGLTCTVIDVGHGSCVLLELPEGKNILYDCGSFASTRQASENASAVLWQRRIRKLDAVILSHADSDHFNGLPELADRFPIETIVMSRAMRDQASLTPMIALLLDEIRAQDIDIRLVSRGDRLEINRAVEMRVLNPPLEGSCDSDNSDSIVLEVGWGDRRILLTGDLEGPGMDRLLQTPGHPYELVTAPHHGSKNSRPREFFQWSRPQYVVVSSHRGKNLGLQQFLPEPDRSRVFHTGFDGAVRLEMKGERVAIRTWTSDPW